jgi:hypothetical protein
VQAEAEAQAAAPERFTFGRLIEAWRLAREGERRPRYVAEVVRCLRQTLAPMLDLDAASIIPGEAVLALDRIKQESGGTTANRTLSYARGCYGWAVKRRMLASNPFAGIERPAREILQTTPRFARCPLVFTTNQRAQVGGFSKYKAALDRRLAKQGTPLAHWTLRDFRRSGVTWLAGAGFPPHVCDKLLNHVGGTISGVAAVYQRAEFLPERARALDAWADAILAAAAGKAESANVVALRAG